MLSQKETTRITIIHKWYRTVTYQILKVVIPIWSIHRKWLLLAEESRGRETTGGSFGDGGCRWSTTRAHGAEGGECKFAQHGDFVSIGSGGLSDELIAPNDVDERMDDLI